jgi:ESCRT-I complex subunit VPS28
MSAPYNVSAAPNSSSALSAAALSPTSRQQYAQSEQAQQQPPRHARRKLNEVKLFDSARERGTYEELSDLYSIIKATEALEVAYARDAVSTSEYGEACSKLISQFRTTESGLVSGGKIASVDKFMKDFSVDCPRAYDRLVRVGVPATVIHASHDDRQESVLVAETVQYFITAMDALKLEQRAVDEIQPLVADLMNALTKIRGLAADFEGKRKLQYWLEQLNKMRAVDNIDEDAARQLIFDLESSYSAFMAYLSRGRS